MGRTNPKLCPFLKYHLENDSFVNLKYEPRIDEEEIFYVELPRYSKEKCEVYEAILKAWYAFNGKSDKYIGYSNGKSVLQAALKKSIYLISLPRFGKRLRFKFATSREIEEKKTLLKERKERSNNLHPPSPANPPSVASSGYSSGNDSETENALIDDDFWKSFSFKAENLTYDLNDIDDFLNDIDMLGFKEDSPLQDTQPNVAPHQIIQTEDFKSLDNMPQFMKPVTELKTTPVGFSGPVKKYWLCTQKINLKGTLQLICELQVAESENSEIKEGSVVIPNDVFEPGVSYNLNKSFELNDLLYFFLSPNCM